MEKRKYSEVDFRDGKGRANEKMITVRVDVERNVTSLSFDFVEVEDGRRNRDSFVVFSEEEKNGDFGTIEKGGFCLKH